MNRSRLRWLLIWWWFLCLTCIVVSANTVKYLPPELISYHERIANAELTQFEIAGLILLSGLTHALFIGSIGLFFCRSWARDTFLISHILGIFLSPFFGPSVMSEWTATLSYLGTLLSGVILYAIYSPPLGEEFTRR